MPRTRKRRKIGRKDLPAVRQSHNEVKRSNCSTLHFTIHQHPHSSPFPSIIILIRHHPNSSPSLFITILIHNHPHSSPSLFITIPIHHHSHSSPFSFITILIHHHPHFLSSLLIARLIFIAVLIVFLIIFTDHHIADDEI